MIPSPFNTVAELVLWSGFEQGDSNGRDSVIAGTFSFGMFETALNDARLEIYRKTLRKQNGEFTEDRAAELKIAERYLATAFLFPNFGSRMQLKFPESNLAAVGSVQIGADTPDPFSKGRQYVEFMYDKIRSIGLAYLESPSTRFAIEVSKDNRSTTQTYSCPCISNYGDCCYETTKEII